MPWKRNPIVAENVNSLARFLGALPAVAWQNATLTLLERTLDDSANRRIVIPEACLAADEVLGRSLSLARELVVLPGAVQATMDRFGPFAAAEIVLLAAAAAGGDRQALHETIRRHSLAAWAAVESGTANPLVERLANEAEILRYVDSGTVRALMAEAAGHVGDAPERARALAKAAREAVTADLTRPSVPAGVA
jgi:adenylosuccinate lyase